MKSQVVSVSPDMSFVAKTEIVNRGCNMLQEVELKSLGHCLGPDMDLYYKLCPVRALKHYLKRTDKIRKNPKKLFIAFNGKETDIAKSTISGWIKKAVITVIKSLLPQRKDLLKSRLTRYDLWQHPCCIAKMCLWNSF